MAVAVRRGVGHIVRAIADMYRLGFTAWRAVPVFVAISAVTEFLQHVVEIRSDMFASRDAARAFANSALRWDFGYVKIAGLIVTMILVGRYWAVGRSWRRALFMPLDTLGRALLAIAVLVGAAYLLSSKVVELPIAFDIARAVVSWIVQTGLIAWIMGILFEDRTMSLRTAFADRFPSAIVMMLLFVMAIFLPGQIIHGIDHRLALGSPAAAVWALMTFDALVVGTMAALAGSGLYVGWRSGLTWRGWRPVSQA